MTSSTKPPSNDSRAGRFDRSEVSRPSGGGRAGGLRLDERVQILREKLESKADARASEALRSDVREARGHVKNWKADSVSEKTADRYTKTVEQMRTNGASPADARCKSTFEFQRSALVHVTRAELKQDLSNLDRFKKSGDLARAADSYNRVRAGLETLRKYPPSTGDRSQDLQRKSAFAGPVHADPDRSNCKRPSIKDLPDGWRDRVQNEVLDKDKAAVSCMSLAGCRPSECKGIKVRQSEDTITLTIKGAKFDENRGIKSREITFDKSQLDQTKAGQDLQKWLGDRPCRTVSTGGGGVEAFRERVNNAADRAGLEQVSAYSFRHAAARDLREQGKTPDEIADRLGHRAKVSQSVYG